MQSELETVVLLLLLRVCYIFLMQNSCVIRTERSSCIITLHFIFLRNKINNTEFTDENCGKNELVFRTELMVHSNDSSTLKRNPAEKMVQENDLSTSKFQITIM